MVVQKLSKILSFRRLFKNTREKGNRLRLRANRKLENIGKG